MKTKYFLTMLFVALFATSAFAQTTDDASSEQMPATKKE